MTRTAAATFFATTAAADTASAPQAFRASAIGHRLLAAAASVGLTAVLLASTLGLAQGYRSDALLAAAQPAAPAASQVVVVSVRAAKG